MDEFADSKTAGTYDPIVLSIQYHHLVQYKELVLYLNLLNM